MLEFRKRVKGMEKNVIAIGKNCTSLPRKNSLGVTVVWNSFCCIDNRAGRRAGDSKLSRRS